jgi:hypothetical protein
LQASTADAINAPLILPNGTLGQRTAAGTSRANFDATELTLWTAASGGSSGPGLTDDGTDLLTISSGSWITEDSSNPFAGLVKIEAGSSLSISLKLRLIAQSWVCESSPLTYSGGVDYDWTYFEVDLVVQTSGTIIRRRFDTHVGVGSVFIAQLGL